MKMPICPTPNRPIGGRPSQSPRRASTGFTLVELLVVITIIGILAGLITAAAMAAFKRAKIATVSMEISQLDMALKMYKEKFGEYPPDGTDAAATARHIQKAFPRCTYTTTPIAITPMNALAFWLGGMPDDRQDTNGNPIGTGQLWGFSADPTDPFDVNTTKKNRCTGRIKPFFEFDSMRLSKTGATVGSADWYRYWPSGGTSSPQYGEKKFNGYAYFRAEGSLGYCTSSGAVKSCGEVKPAVDSRTGGITASNTAWINPQSFQIFCAGFDGTYAVPTTPVDRLLFPTGENYGTNTFGSAFDDITNFSGGTLEDRMP